jgi:hypothetical protein
MKSVFVERLLQPKYMWRAIKRAFWELFLLVHPFCNMHSYYGPAATFAYEQWGKTLMGSHGWRCTAPGKMTYFEG